MKNTKEIRMKKFGNSMKWLWRGIRRKKWIRIVTTILFLLLFGVAISVSEKTVITETPVREIESESDLKMDVLDVGQGLSLLFRSGDQYMLYDGGDRDYSSRVVSYLKKKNVQTLEYVIASHYDSDHLNGIVGALNVFDVKNVIAPDYSTDTSVYQSFRNILEKKNLKTIVPSAGETYAFGNGSFTILAPNGNTYEDNNDYSVCIRIDCANQSVLVTGDATVLSEAEMLSNGQELEAEILVLGHHGSGASTSEAFLKKVSPDMAVISCGLDNAYLHPSQRVMELLEKEQIPVYRTDKQGDLEFVLDGETIRCSKDPSGDYSYGTAEEISVETEGVPEAKETDHSEQEASVKYVLNTKTGKFHDSSCSSVKKIAEYNYATSNESRDTLINQGYSPCGKCKP